MVCLVAVGRMHHNRCCLLVLLVLLCGQDILGVLHHTCFCVLSVLTLATNKPTSTQHVETQHVWELSWSAGNTTCHKCIGAVTQVRWHSLCVCVVAHLGRVCAQDPHHTPHTLCFVDWTNCFDVAQTSTPKTMSHRDERPPGTCMCVSGLSKDKQTNHVVPEALLEVATGRGWPAMVASSFGFPKAAHQPQCSTKWLLLVKANGGVWCALAVFTLLVLVMVMHTPGIWCATCCS